MRCLISSTPLGIKVSVMTQWSFTRVFSVRSCVM
jgi:hypothetical protein